MHREYVPIYNPGSENLIHTYPGKEKLIVSIYMPYMYLRSQSRIRKSGSVLSQSGRLSLTAETMLICITPSLFRRKNFQYNTIQLAFPDPQIRILKSCNRFLISPSCNAYNNIQLAFPDPQIRILKSCIQFCFCLHALCGSVHVCVGNRLFTNK
jgi:hypothetical protein